MSALLIHQLDDQSDVDRALGERRTLCGLRGERTRGVRWRNKTSGVQFKATAVAVLPSYSCRKCLKLRGITIQ